ncbi:MAG: tRNA (guanosine(37)-N1)-methyltransferase TrmD [Hyphomicrobium zavarzinii]|uniref:tRNA (guanosine(37)-N1)-methyltransferase TrmD n=1 Tax=Hyphomicrobium zavarzinii TaxID=48292 RepID=UPI001A3DC371|nr:tRNA (guanosine(37)-N1)-methyltransferase TrmD [Hyphomicrobium zavarzinii]MBL8847906.1 tRNA (guanosine(37)-N1)-methyltransferase TrmD [Hyphomicrobium zavarzinii]
MPHIPTAGDRTPWRASVLTLFPEMFPGPLRFSLVGQALEAGLWSLALHQIRDCGIGRHRAVDDTPTGGGAGMVMRADVLAAAIDQARSVVPDLPLIYMSPRGAPFTQARARALSEGPGVMLLAGRFEGIDERVIEGRGIEEISIGDYVLSGGELAAMTLLDACVRLIPGVLGAADSLTHESFEGGLLEYPQYTKPREWEGRATPEVLLSGDHARIAAWRRAEAERITRERRPDLLARKTKT